MRAVVVLVAAVTLVTACTPAASSPAEGSTPASASVAAEPTPVPSPLATGGAPTGGASPGTPASPEPAASASAAPGTGGTPGLLGASPVTTGPPLPPNPFDLGGPAPVGSFVLGDSISLSVGPALARLGYPVLGVVGQSTSEAYLRAHLTGPTAQAAPAWVIVLGTNNTADPSDVARLAGWVDLIDSLRTPGARQKVYWVTPHRPPTYVGSKSTWNLAAFNAELKRLDDERGWLRTIDFDAVAKAHPEWFDQDTAMHLHPDANGQGVLVALIAGPDAVPVAIPAPLFTGPPTSSAASTPETFVTSPRRPSPTPTPSQTPSTPAAPTGEATAPSTPVPLEPAPESAAPSATPS